MATPPPRIDIALLLLCTLLGLLMARTSLCTVAGVQQSLRERRWQPMAPVLAATSTAGVVLLAILLAHPGTVALPQSRALSPTLLLGGALLGVGALVNGACYLGSVTYLGRGNANFLFTLLGLGIASRIPLAAAVADSAMPRATPTMQGAAVGCALFAALLLASAWRGGAPAPGAPASANRPGALAAAAGCGACAGIVFAMHPMWSYGALIDALARAGGAMWASLLPAALLFAGAIAGALLQHAWKPAPLEAMRAARCLAGGAIMGLGARLVPGGNDMLLLWTIPGLAFHGIAAYLSMVATIAALTIAGSRTGVRRSG